MLLFPMHIYLEVGVAVCVLVHVPLGHEVVRVPVPVHAVREVGQLLHSRTQK